MGSFRSARLLETVLQYIQVRCIQAVRLQRRYDDEGVPFPEAASAIAMAAPIEPKPSPAALERLSSSAVDLLKMAEARAAALQTKVTDRYVERTATLRMLQ